MYVIMSEEIFDLTEYLQDPPQLDTTPPAMSPNGKRKVFQSISSAFSRMSSPRGDSLEIQSTPTSDPSSPCLHPRKKRQRIYQSFSSAFSKKISPRANSPEPTSPSPANLPEVFQSPSNPSSTPEENDDYNMIEEVPRPMENEEEMEDSGYSLRREPEIDEPGTMSAQPQSDANGALTGMFVFAPGIEEVMSALEDLKKIFKPPRHAGKGYRDPGLDLVFRARLEGMRQFMWTYINILEDYNKGNDN